MSKVFFTAKQANLLKLFKIAGFEKLISEGDPVALKIHFGEPGNKAFLSPDQVKILAARIKALGGDPFYTDCNTLYKGPRQNTLDHMKVAGEHGFTVKKANAPAVIPEEEDYAIVNVNLNHFNVVYISGAAARAAMIISLAHFKGHDQTGFGGALKNIGMGLGTRRGKLYMHSDCKNCEQAKTCQKMQTISSCWVGSSQLLQEKMVEYALGAVKGKHAGYINFLTKVSPNCDCYAHNDPPIVPDIGILASLDPVALDQASADLVNKTEGRLKSKDKFRELYPKVDWTIQLRYAEEIGMGHRKYELIKID